MSDSSRRGRTRSETTRLAILEATRDELAAHGYDKLSIDRIAAAAGAGKQTVYRWYPSKSALVAECVLEGYLSPLTNPVPDTGDARRDLRAWLDTFAGHLARPRTSALIRALAAAAAESDDVAVRFYEDVTGSVEEAVAARLRTAQDRRPGAMATAAAEALIGAMLYRLLVRQPATPEFLDSLIDTVFSGTRGTGGGTDSGTGGGTDSSTGGGTGGGTERATAATDPAP
ncbi:TetR/AcrR family transcriptional regulator [Streptomyces corynorhini]|uniref:TetR/AcrR family transcriptional regulator n=1 Tax=Streptomyces corynorhini TaxID=2282652 RepID=A0A370B6I8_9ACTN|nr:TetR/AcrR family transcriptional regulator [Streptomyces corynorhini]RDG35999.1 TetR/AcrR family transcriptional regulator [Streptomyces corynorhini]